MKSPYTDNTDFAWYVRPSGGVGSIISSSVRISYGKSPGTDAIGRVCYVWSSGVVYDDVYHGGLVDYSYGSIF